MKKRYVSPYRNLTVDIIKKRFVELAKEKKPVKFDEYANHINYLIDILNTLNEMNDERAFRYRGKKHKRNEINQEFVDSVMQLKLIRRACVG